ncbi:MAG TPA: prepilin peptidase [Phycisphaerae bacterium]|nr:prepilin peptidase [Phycisphaerae bacterium]
MAEGWILIANNLVIPVAILGAIVGSFLNVVIYRLPLGLSVFSPRWSFCPHCRRTIRPLDNIPIVGWLILKGRCRACGVPISPIYPLIEALTALVFVTLWDVLFTARLVPGIAGVRTDWPMILAYFALFSGLLASSAMDIESYTIDIRISIVVMIVAVAAHAVRGMPDVVLTTTDDRSLGFLPPGLCVIAAAGGLTWLTGWVVMAAWPRPRTAADVRPGEVTTGVSDPAPSEPPTSSPSSESSAIPIVLLTLLVIALIIWQRVAPDFNGGLPFSPVALRFLIASVICMTALILASWIPRPVDAEIVGEIEDSRHHARSLAVRELATFVPALIVAIGVFLWLRGREGVSLRSEWTDLHRAYADSWHWAKFVGGALHAIGGMVIGAALGWTVRIMGTLAFGKEAYGTGDIYLMGTIGAAAGVANLVFGFFLAAVLALIGVAASLFHKSNRVISFGPWLALGSFVALALEGFLLDFFKPATGLLWSLISGTSAWRFGG